jgi:DNA polymerase
VNLREERIYLTDQAVNDRGVLVDLPSVNRLVMVIDKYLEDCKARVQKITNGKVTSLNGVASILAFLKDHCDLTDFETGDVLEVKKLDASAIESLVPRLVDPLAIELLELRSLAAKASVSKLKKMELAACSDNRVRGMLYYYGAGTGRWTSMLIQMQNLPRGMALDDLTIEELFINLHLMSVEEWLEWVGSDIGKPMHVVSSMVRGCFIPAPGNEFLIVDYASIETRVLAWAAQQENMLDAFKDGEDLYKQLAGAIFDVPATAVTKDQRQFGKTGILGCGYQLGKQGMLNQLAGKTLPEGTNRDDMADQVVQTYRMSYPDVCNLWWDLDQEAKACLGNDYESNLINDRFRFRKEGKFMMLDLPSGRPIVYPDARLCGAKGASQEEKDEEVSLKLRTGQPKYRKLINNRWQFTGLYGGKITENAIQGLARDLLADAMVRLNDGGWNPILSVHDEIICECPIGTRGLAEMESIMCELPPWAKGLPLASEGFVATRYRK